MKRSWFITLFISTHILFILLIIHKQNRFIDLSYQNQKKEKQKNELLNSKKELTNQLYAQANHSHIKTYAIKNGMEPISLAQVKKIASVIAVTSTPQTISNAVMQ